MSHIKIQLWKIILRILFSRIPPNILSLEYYFGKSIVEIKNGVLIRNVLFVAPNFNPWISTHFTVLSRFQMRGQFFQCTSPNNDEYWRRSSEDIHIWKQHFEERIFDSILARFFSWREKWYSESYLILLRILIMEIE